MSWRRNAIVAVTKVIGHGVEAKGPVFRCAHCAREAGETALRDRAQEARRSASRKSAVFTESEDEMSVETLISSMPNSDGAS